MKDKQDLMRGWLAKAESDLAAVRHMLDSTGPYDTSCFHVQQAIEKMLKAYLAFHDQAIPWIHDLEELQRLCLAVESIPDLRALDLTQVSDYAVSVRYDLEFWPDQEVARAALALAEQVRQIILKALHTSNDVP